ncbi:MAG: hypothetical protein AUG09_05030 [Acidobacteria bacterium 13_1_20CM_2_68_7]|nr:MAG: hypothetical protein AUG09_05030 [Acidobacteria bacterium 13_1_20CM_2_68_7]
METARAAMERAAAAEGVARAPELCAAAHSALARAEAEVRVQSRRRFWSRDYAEAARLAYTARLAAEICAFRAGAVRARQRAGALSTVQDLETSIPRVADLARHARDEVVASDILNAEIALGEARSAVEKQQYERAREASERGLAHLAEAVTDINRIIDDFNSGPRRMVWTKWVKATLDESARTGEAVILVDKLRRELHLFRRQEEIVSYPVDLGVAGVASKTHAGDDATPEGRYRITEIRGPGQTHYYRALMIDYPNAEDRSRFRRLKRAGQLPGDQEIGSLIEIHGQGGRSQDWTKGCVALENDDMDDLVPQVHLGTAVTIVGTIPDETLP